MSTKVTISELKKIIKETLNESSLTRLHSHMTTNECIIISASRNDPYDLSACRSKYVSDAEKQKLSIEEVNKLNNRDLKAILLKKGYGVTAVDGSFVENYMSQDPQKPPIEVREDSLFVVNLNNDPNFFNTLSSLGERYCQDSIISIPKGGKDLYLYGTNNSPYVGYHQKIPVGDVALGKEGEFMTKIRNRPFTTNESIQTYQNLSRLERMAVSAISKKILGE